MTTRLDWRDALSVRRFGGFAAAGPCLCWFPAWFAGCARFRGGLQL